MNESNTTEAERGAALARVEVLVTRAVNLSVASMMLMAAGCPREVSRACIEAAKECNEVATELLEGMEAKGLVKRSKIRGGKRWVVA